MTNKEKDTIRNNWIEWLTEKLHEAGEEDVLRTKSNEIAIPFTTEEGEEGYLCFTLKIPSGTRDGEAYDAYEEAEGYKDHLEEKAIKAEAAAKKKAAKIAADAKARAEKAAARVKK